MDGWSSWPDAAASRSPVLPSVTGAQSVSLCLSVVSKATSSPTVHNHCSGSIKFYQQHTFRFKEFCFFCFWLLSSLTCFNFLCHGLCFWFFTQFRSGYIILHFLTCCPVTLASWSAKLASGWKTLMISPPN